jgi:polygalacturonase
MKRILSLLCLLVMLSTALQAKKKQQPVAPTWPDGTRMEAWFTDTTHVDVCQLGRQWLVTDYGVRGDDSLTVQTQALQRVIDQAAEQGGGVVVIPQGVFLSGALHFRQGTHLWLQQGARLKGSDRIADFPVCTTRIEGQTCKYFPALVNADGLDGFTILGPGTIDGNGRHYWQEFWIRREWNPQCTNKDAQRPRLVYISNSRNVTVQGVRTINSPFWTNHLYRCERVRYLDCFIYAPTKGVVIKGSDKQYGAPSSDAIDLDVCHDVLVHGCFMQVNDDAVVIKGGKGTWADQNPDNGPVYNVLVDNCVYGRVHGCLTVGSESIDDWNIVIRNIKFNNADRVLWLKMRPDTPQQYRLISVENVSGTCGSFLVIRPWTQFYKPGERKDMPLSHCCDVTIRDIDVDSKNFFDVGTSDKYELSNFTFENCRIKDKKGAFNPSLINGCKVENVKFF